MAEQCSVEKWQHHRSIRCPNPVKGYLKNGSPACGVHLAGEKRRIANTEKWEAELLDRDAFREEVDSFSSIHIIKDLRPHDPKYRLVTIPFEELKRLIEQ